MKSHLRLFSLQLSPVRVCHMMSNELGSSRVIRRGTEGARVQGGLPSFQMMQSRAGWSQLLKTYAD